MSDIVIRKGSKDDLLTLCNLDFTWEAMGRFDVIQESDSIRIAESMYEKPVLRGQNQQYHDEIKKYASYADQPDALMLVAFLDRKPVGYISAFVEEWKGGMVVNGEGILVGREFRGRGIAKALVSGLVDHAKNIPNCRGIVIEMDTEKYEANKLLLSMGFVFAGTRLFIHSGESPQPGSKEALYFYYSL